MEGREADEAHLRYLIERMTPEERYAGFREELKKLCEKWLVEDPLIDAYEEGFSDGQRDMIDGGGP